MRKILSIALSLMLALSLCLFVTACGGDKDLDGVKFESKTVTYNGQEQSIVATNVPEGVTVTYNGNTGTNAGTYNATATFEGEGYKTKTLSATLTIEKANAVIDAQATQRIAYTGQPITVAATLTAGVGDLTYSATPTNVGTYEITVSVAASDNFNAASVKVQLEIYDDSQLPQLELPDLAVTGLEKTYTGSALTPDVAGIPADVTYKFVDASGNAVTMTEVGSYKIFLVASKEGYKDFKSQEYTFVISGTELPQLELPDLAVTGLEKTYTGSALTPDVAGIPSDVMYKFVDASGNELEPMINNGTYTVYIKASKAGFKDFMSDAYTFVIKSSGGLDDIIVEEEQQVVYNGELQKPSFQNVPEDAEIVWLYEDEAIDAGEDYYFEVQFVLGREESDVYYITLDILKADPVFTGETVQTYEANGNLITLQGVSVDNDEQKNSLYFTPADGYTAVGEYTITANVPESINYNAGSKDFTLKIIGLSDEQAKPVFTHADGTPFTETSIEVTFKKSFEWPDLKAMSNTAVEGFDDFTPVDISDKIEVRLLNSTSDYIIGPAWTLLSEAPAYLPSDFRGYTLEIRVTNTIYGGFTTTLTLDVEVLDNPDYEYIQNMVNGETADTDWVLSAGDAYINEYGQPVVGVPAAGQMGTVDFPSVSYAGQKVVNGDIVTTTFNGTTDGVMFHNFGMMFTHDWDKDAPTSGNASWLNFFAFRMEANTTRCYVWMSAGQKEEMPMFGGEIESLMDGRDHTLSMQVTVGRDENGKGIAYVNLWIDTDVSLAPDYTDTITEDMMNSVFNSPERPWPEYMFDAENAGGWVGFGTKRSQKGTGSLTIKGLDIKKPGATDSAMLNPPSLTVDAPEQIYDLNAEVTFGVPAATNLNTYKDLTDRVIVTLYKPDGTPVVLDNTAPKYTLADIGTYKLVYYVKDESGNVSYKEFSFNAIPELATPPTITLDTENREFKSGLNKTFTLPVATGADANGNPLDVTVSVDNIEASPASMSIINNGQITFRAVGEYKITYSATDLALQTTTETITVKVYGGVDGEDITGNVKDFYNVADTAGSNTYVAEENAWIMQPSASLVYKGQKIYSETVEFELFIDPALVGTFVIQYRGGAAMANGSTLPGQGSNTNFAWENGVTLAFRTDQGNILLDVGGRDKGVASANIDYVSLFTPRVDGQSTQQYAKVRYQSVDAYDDVTGRYLGLELKMWINDELLTWAGAATQNGRLIFTPTMMENNPDFYAASWLSFWALTSGSNSGSRVKNITITRNDDYAVDPDALSGEFTLDMDENYNKEATVGSAYTFPDATLMMDGVAFEDENYPVTRQLSLGSRVISEDLADATEYTPLAPGTYTVSYIVDGIERASYTFTAVNSVKPTTNLLDEEGWGHSWINEAGDTVTTDKVLGSVPVYDEWITYHFNYQVGDSQIYLPVRGDWSLSVNPDWFYGLSIRFSGTEGLWIADQCTSEVYKIFAYEDADYTYEGLFGENIKTEKSEHFLSYRAVDIVDSKGIVTGIKLYIVIDGKPLTFGENDYYTVSVKADRYLTETYVSDIYADGVSKNEQGKTISYFETLGIYIGESPVVAIADKVDMTATAGVEFDLPAADLVTPFGAGTGTIVINDVEYKDVTKATINDAGIYTVYIRFNGVDYPVGKIEVLSTSGLPEGSVVFEDAEYIYDGTSVWTLEASKVPADSTVTYKYYSDAEYKNEITEDIINAGTYYVIATVKAPGYVAQDFKAVMTVKGAAIEGATLDSVTVKADGTSHTIDVTFEGGKPSDATVEIKYYSDDKYENEITEVKEVGTYYVKATITRPNYETLVLTATIVVSDSLQEITGVNFDDNTVTYTGEEFVIEVTGELPEGVTVKYLDNKGTDAGTYKATAVLSGEGFYTLTLEATLTINPADINPEDVVFENASVMLDGSEYVFAAQVPAGYSVKYIYNDTEYTEFVVTEAGTYEVTAVITKENYNELRVTATLTAVLFDKDKTEVNIGEIGDQVAGVEFALPTVSVISNGADISDKISVYGNMDLYQLTDLATDATTYTASVFGKVTLTYKYGDIVLATKEFNVNSNGDIYAETENWAGYSYTAARNYNARVNITMSYDGIYDGFSFIHFRGEGGDGWANNYALRIHGGNLTSTGTLKGAETAQGDFYTDSVPTPGYMYSLMNGKYDAGTKFVFSYKTVDVVDENGNFVEARTYFWIDGKPVTLPTSFAMVGGEGAYIKIGPKDGGYGETTYNYITNPAKIHAGGNQDGQKIPWTVYGVTVGDVMSMEGLVSFAPSALIVPEGGEIKFNTSAPEGITCNITYKSETYEESETAPTAIGEYIVTATFSGTGYLDKVITANLSIVAPGEDFTADFVGGIGATGTAPESITQTENLNIVLPENSFIKDGFVFEGWSDGDQTYKPGEEYQIKGNVTFKASWKKIIYGNLIANGDLAEDQGDKMFENGYSVGARTWVSTESATDDGTGALKLDGTSSVVAAGAKVNLVKGITYTISFSIKWASEGSVSGGGYDSGGNYIKDPVGNNIHKWSVSPKWDDVWYKFEHTFTAELDGEYSFNANIVWGGGTGIAYIDDISCIAQVAEGETKPFTEEMIAAVELPAVTKARHTGEEISFGLLASLPETATVAYYVNDTLLEGETFKATDIGVYTVNAIVYVEGFKPYYVDLAFEIYDVNPEEIAITVEGVSSANALSEMTMPTVTATYDGIDVKDQIKVFASYGAYDAGEITTATYTPNVVGTMTLSYKYGETVIATKDIAVGFDGNLVTDVEWDDFNGNVLTTVKNYNARVNITFTLSEPSMFLIPMRGNRSGSTEWWQNAFALRASGNETFMMHAGTTGSSFGDVGKLTGAEADWFSGSYHTFSYQLTDVIAKNGDKTIKLVMWVDGVPFGTPQTITSENYTDIFFTPAPFAKNFTTSGADGKYNVSAITIGDTMDMTGMVTMANINTLTINEWAPEVKGLDKFSNANVTFEYFNSENVKLDAKPTEAGSYKVTATITADNYKTYSLTANIELIAPTVQNTLNFVSGTTEDVGEAPADMVKYQGELVEIPDNTFVRPDYLFRGWSDGEKVYAEGEEYVITGDKTFTAQWEAIVYGDLVGNGDFSVEPTAENGWVGFSQGGEFAYNSEAGTWSTGTTTHAYWGKDVQVQKGVTYVLSVDIKVTGMSVSTLGNGCTVAAAVATATGAPWEQTGVAFASDAEWLKNGVAEAAAVSTDWITYTAEWTATETTSVRVMIRDWGAKGVREYDNLTFQAKVTGTPAFTMNANAKTEADASMDAIASIVYNKLSLEADQTARYLTVEELKAAIPAFTADYYIAVGDVFSVGAVESIKVGEVTFTADQMLPLSVGKSCFIKDKAFKVEGRTLYVAAPIIAIEAVNGTKIMINDNEFAFDLSATVNALTVNGVAFQSGAASTVTAAEAGVYNIAAKEATKWLGISYEGAAADDVILTRKFFDGKLQSYGLTSTDAAGSDYVLAYYPVGWNTDFAAVDYANKYVGKTLNYGIYVVGKGAAELTFNFVAAE